MTRSVRIHEFGGPEVLGIEEINLTPPKEGEVRLRIQAIGLNRTEITLRSGRSPAKPALPTGLGFEAAGIIETIGPGVTGVEVGARVALVPAYGAAQYALYSEAANVPARSLVAIPDGIGFAEAAATWAAYGTAWGGLIAVGHLKAGQTVLISAASSSVGIAAIQTARRLGARPIALTRSAAKVDALRALGADAVIASSQTDIVADLFTLTGQRGADLVFDPVGGPGFATLARATATGGTLILYGALETRDTVIPPFDIFARNLTVRGVALTALTRDDATLAAMKRFVTEGLLDGSLKPAIAQIFSLDQVADAHRFLEAGEQVGKAVITL